jgi:hypothetical protein
MDIANSFRDLHLQGKERNCFTGFTFLHLHLHLLLLACATVTYDTVNPPRPHQQHDRRQLWMFGIVADSERG